MNNVTTMTKASTTRTPDAPKPGAVYPLMSSGMRSAVDLMAEFLPRFEDDQMNMYSGLRPLISGILEAVEAPLSREQCWDVADLVVGSIRERAKSPEIEAYVKASRQRST